MIVWLEGSLIPRQYKTIPVRDSRQRPSRHLLSKSKWVKQGRWHDETQFSQGLRTSLLQMGNIKSLTLYDFDWLWTISHSVVRTALVPGSLTSLILSGPAYRGGFRRTGGNYELAMILRQQPLFERLELRAGDWNMDEWILPTDIPHLRTLVSGVIEAIKLVPCRPVTSLNLIDIRQVPEDAAWQALATSASPILTLVLNIGLNHLKGILRGAAAYLIEVESLYLKGICAQDLGVIRKRFPMFHRLRTVHVPPGVCWHIITDPQRINFTEGIKLRCPSIEEVFLERVV
ncbi:hypothetical protein FRB94_009791 [Tulasnella sp. JGI-2019a]|nr:hypothetical protein FRB93_009022 [Tulasnella sp. JGI-2019a]KAG8994570.1 hypothetical protein FRB94_009791 [Tulasnella sp. JGI-2019a]